MISARTIDQLLLSFCDAHWRKVARVIGKSFEVLERCGIRPSNTVAKIIDMRMASLVDSGRLQAQGNIRKWRYSEVRLPDRPPMLQVRIPAALSGVKKTNDKTTPGKRVARIQRIHSPLSMSLRRAQ